MGVYINRSKSALIILILTVLAGIAMITSGVKESIEMKNFKDNCEKTTGTIVNYKTSEDSNDNTIYYAIYEYHVADNTYTIQDTKSSHSSPSIGDTDVIYFEPTNPRNATTDLYNGKGPILIVVGLAFAIIAVAFILARQNVNEAVVRILIGIVCILVGGALPIVARIWWILIVTIIFVICGIIVIIKAITKMTGNEGGEIDQAIDEKLEQAGDVLLDVVTAIDSKSSDSAVSKVGCIIKIIKGLFIICFSIPFVAIGGFCIYKGEYLGALFFVVGLGIMISGIREIIRARRE